MMSKQVTLPPQRAVTPQSIGKQGILQRKCACGQHTVAAGECAECRKKRLQRERSGVLQRRAVSDHSPAVAPPIVYEVLRSPGRPLAPETQALMESRFNYDFGRLQTHTVGPRAIQTRLTFNTPGDKYEQEADRVTEQVIKMLEPRLQRQAPTMTQRETNVLRTSPLVREYVGSEVIGKSEAPDIVHKTLHSPGQPLDFATRAFFEPRFGTDFSNVRVHTDGQAAESAEAVNAIAYTVGWDVVFGKGQYSPREEQGRRLIAHELTHVIQQNSNAVSPQKIQRTIGDGHDFPPASRFSGNAILEAVFDNERVLENGSSGVPVELVQQALIALNYPLLRFGADGEFGDETRRAVEAFQRDVGLAPDGRVGFHTIDFLDKRDRGEEVSPPVRPVVANAPFDVSNAIVQPGAAPSNALGPGVWGLTFPENVEVGIDVFDNGGVWQPVLTSVTGNYSLQTRLLPPPPVTMEVTGPGGNTNAANYCAQINDLNRLTHFQGAWFMESAVLAHERVHAEKFRPAVIDPAVIGPLEAALEAITLPRSVFTPNAAAAEIFIRLDPAFATALTAAQANWLAQILVLVAGDHAAGGPCDTAEHEIVDPMIRRICFHARSNGWAPCPPLCP